MISVESFVYLFIVYGREGKQSPSGFRLAANTACVIMKMRLFENKLHILNSTKCYTPSPAGDEHDTDKTTA